MLLNELIDFLEAWAPLPLQESYDNAGLIVGDPNKKISKAIVSLDCTEAVIDEAIKTGAELVISHHPIVFRGLKKFTGSSYVERTVMKAIKNDVAIYAIHTNLDNVHTGVNAEICKRLELQNTHVLAPKNGLLAKLVTFCPVDKADAVRNALFAAGAGHVGNYAECSFSSNGEGTFSGNSHTQPYVGEPGKRHIEAEVRIETIIPLYKRGAVLRALFASHPYEEVAYDICPLANNHAQIGAGMLGELETALPTLDFLKGLKQKMKAGVVKYTSPVKGKVQKIAVCGGSGGFLLNDAIRAGADIFITSDYKYHEFFDADNCIVIADIGHYESEQFTPELLIGKISKQFPNFAALLTGVNTNPVNYL